MSLGIRVDISGADGLQLKLRGLSGAHLGELLATVGDMAITQTKRRIDTTKEGPDGAPWPDWAESYRKTRKPSDTLLHSSGLFEGSLDRDVEGLQVVVGSPKIQAAVLQLGWEQRNIKARPYLGLNDKDQEEILQHVADFFGNIVGDA